MLAACNKNKVDATPVWFMRQAGRCIPQYRELREKYDLLTIAKTPELSTQVSIMPVDLFGVDAAVMFADIMIPLEGMGIPFEISPSIGPIIHNPVRTQSDVGAIRVADAEEATPYVFQMIKMLRSELKDRAAVVGFSGAPFTLACYLIEGKPSRDYSKTKTMMLGNPGLWNELMTKVTEVIVRYLRAQIKAGVQVVQLFDSWIGALSPKQYEQYVMPYSKRVFSELSNTGVPRIYFGTGASSLLPIMAGTECDIVSVDWRVMLDDAWAAIGSDKGIQGNLDPAALLAPFEVIKHEASEVLRLANGRPGHVFNLGHGVLPETDPNDLARLVDFVHEQSSRA